MPERTASFVACLLLATTAARSQAPVGPEFRVNAYTTGQQRISRVAADASGNFIVSWSAGSGQDGSGYGAFARRYDAAGLPLSATEFRVNTYTLDYQRQPVPAFDASGRFVVAWTSRNQDGVGDSVFAQRFQSTGALLGGEFAVNTYATGAQYLVSVAASAAGAFVVAWTDSHLETGTSLSSGVFARRFDSSGVPGSVFRVNTYTTGFQGAAAVSMSADGGFFVVWQSTGEDASGSAGVFGRRYDAAGAALGGAFPVNVYTTGAQFGASVASDTNGNAVVVWHSQNQFGPGTSSVMGRRYDAAGAALGGEFVVSPQTGSHYDGSVALDADGTFVVAWTSYVGAGTYTDVLARRFDANGPLGEAFRVNTYTTHTQQDASVALSPGGDFVVNWSSADQDGNAYGVFAQRFRPDAIFADGFESGTLSSWSLAATDGGDLATSAGAALRGTTVGLQAVVDDTAGLYVQDDRPRDEKRYRARFHLDSNGFDPGESSNHRRTRTLIAFSEGPNRRVAAVVLRRLGGAYSLMARARLDDDTQMNTAFFPVSDGPHAVEIDLVAAAGPASLDGSLELWIDGASMAHLTGLDNSLAEVDFVRMGALSVKAGAAGTLYFDEFESRRLTPVGP